MALFVYPLSLPSIPASAFPGDAKVKANTRRQSQSVSYQLGFGCAILREQGREGVKIEGKKGRKRKERRKNKRKRKKEGKQMLARASPPSTKAFHRPPRVGTQREMDLSCPLRMVPYLLVFCSILFVHMTASRVSRLLTESVISRALDTSRNRSNGRQRDDKILSASIDFLQVSRTN